MQPDNVPFEIRHMFHTHHPGLTLAALGINVAIVGVMAYSLVMRRRRHSAAAQPTLGKG